jgi:hypothetical protein
MNRIKISFNCYITGELNAIDFFLSHLKNQTILMLSIFYVFLVLS